MEKMRYKRGVIVGEGEMESAKIEIDINRTGKAEHFIDGFKFEDHDINLETRALGEFEGKAIYLPSRYDWVLCEDEEGATCLLPLKRENK